ncbi:MAG: hypothetical protein AAGF11_02400 [Myxococcota bacterium]
MVYLSKFRPTDVRPELLVDRDDAAEWLEHSISAYLADRDPEQGQGFCVLGSKGVGKSILTRAVLQKLKEVHAATTLFVEVDCRGALRQRKVLKQVVEQVHAELYKMNRYGSPGASRELLASAAVLKTLASFDQVERKTVHEHLTEFKAAAGADGKLLDFIASEFQISLRRRKQEAIEGKVLLDDDNIREALLLLLRDIRLAHEDLDIIVYLDNIDELDHDAYWSDEGRERVRAQTLGLMQLWRAPVGLVLNMRTYYSSILLREVSKRFELLPLDDATLEQILARRLHSEQRAVQEALGNDLWNARRSELAGMASTPLSFLMWFEYLAERIKEPEERSMAEVLMGFARTHAATVSQDVLRRIAGIFEGVEAAVPRERLLAACGGNEALLSQAIRSQIVLPLDFWQPNEFTLDPELHFLLARTPDES